MAADKVYVSAEQIIPTDDFLKHGPVHTLRIPRMYVSGVVEAPMGSHFCECPPDYERDEAFQREYAATAKDDDAWQAFKSKYLDLPTHDDYVKAVQAREGK
jgi:glutaconate CoA-transferase, subunit A